MKFVIRIPKLDITLEAKDKKHALKEAKSVIKRLLEIQGYWVEEE